MSKYKYHVRNPIKRHGDTPRDHFTIVPNELVRDTELSNHAYRVASVIRSHAEDYEVSVKSLAEMLGWGRVRTREALQELVATRWLAIRRYKTASGTRAFEEYHLNVSRKFTEPEAAEYHQTITLPAGRTHDLNQGTSHDLNQITPMTSVGSPPCPEPSHPHDPSQVTKEYESEDQGENTKGENHSGRQALTAGLEDEDDGWFGALASSRADAAYPPPEKKTYTMREWKEIEAAGGVEAYEAMRAASQDDHDSVLGRRGDAADTCWGCRTNGRDACSVHSRHLHPVSA